MCHAGVCWRIDVSCWCVCVCVCVCVWVSRCVTLVCGVERAIDMVV